MDQRGGDPRVFKKRVGEGRCRRVARFRLGNEMEERKYWEEENKIRCRLCEEETESWEHVLEDCREWWEGGGTWQEAFEGF